MGEPVRCLEATDGQEALRIFDSRRSSDSGGLSAQLTLSEFVALYYKPVHLVTTDSRPRNLEEIQKTVDYWVRFVTKGGALPEPQLCEIGILHCADFIGGLKKLPGRKYPTMGNNTVRKHAAAIQAILDLCGQPDREHRECLGLMDRIPYVSRPPKEDKEAEDCFTFDELERLLDNADAAKRPSRLPCSAGDYIRRLYVFLFNSGVRITGAMEAKWKHCHGDHLILQARSGVKGRRDQRVELNEAAQQVVESMQGFDAERIFPWPRWPCSAHNLYDEHNRIRQCLPKHRRFAFHAVRKLTNNELARINPKACEKVLGHQLGRTNVESYTSRTVAADALSQMRKLTMKRELQRELFE